MSVPDRLPHRRLFSHGESSVYPAPVNKRVSNAEAATFTDLSLHELDTLRREIKAEREVASNMRLVQHVTEKELTFYDHALDEVGSSLMKQRRLADRMALLVTLNDDTVERFRR